MMYYSYLLRNTFEVALTSNLTELKSSHPFSPFLEPSSYLVHINIANIGIHLNQGNHLDRIFYFINKLSKLFYYSQIWFSSYEFPMPLIT